MRLEPGPTGDLIDILFGKLPAPGTRNDRLEIGGVGSAGGLIAGREKFRNAELAACGSSERPEPIMPVWDSCMDVERR
jgi:hypothetical protein